MKKKLLLLLYILSLAINSYAGDYARRYPTDTALEVITPNSGDLRYLRKDQDDTSSYDYKLGDIDIYNLTPHLEFRITSDNTAFMFHANANGQNDPWGIFQLWRGTDTGTGFNVNPDIPLLYLNNNNNWSFDNNTLYVDAVNNRVGIGTNAPESSLHIIGDWTVDNPITDAVFLIRSLIAGCTPALRFNANGVLWDIGVGASDSDYAGAMFIWNWALNENALTIAANGNLLLSYKLGFIETGATPTYYSYFQGGDQAADLTYTLPTAFPASIAFLKISNAGVMTTDIATYVTSVTGTAPVTSSGGTTPAISMAAATSLVNGYLTSTDWSTFNNKQATISVVDTSSIDLTLTGAQISGVVLPGGVDHNSLLNYSANRHIDHTGVTLTLTSPLSGSGDISANRTFSLAGLSSLGTANYIVGVNSGATAWEYKNLATGTSGTDFAIVHTAGVITFNLPTASGTNTGKLSNTDWTTFTYACFNKRNEES